ncbi:MAG: ParB/RepB/Spo0J family partition protein [Desulfurococcaceae archaeon]|nr:ParB/RepB/Spo0J family partition protein [Desulfurococcaceae archaeon]
MATEQRQEVVQLEVDKILVPEERVTSVLDEEILQELEESIKQHGILQPLQVAEVDGKYVLIDGLHRLSIARKLGMKTVPCIVKKMTEDQLLITNLIMNRQRGKSNPAQEAMVLKKLVDDYKYSINDAAQLLGMSRSTAERYYQIATQCSQRVLEALGDGMISVGCAYWLSFVEDKSKQDEILINAIKWGYTVDQCKAAVMSVVSPQVETPYMVLPTGEIKPKPVPVYPCGREVDPSKVVVVQVDAEVWPVVQEAFRQLCVEGFFYGEQQPTAESTTEEAAEEVEEVQQPPPPQPQPRKPEKRDWFLEKL